MLYLKVQNRKTRSILFHGLPVLNGQIAGQALFERDLDLRSDQPGADCKERAPLICQPSIPSFAYPLSRQVLARSSRKPRLNAVRLPNGLPGRPEGFFCSLLHRCCRHSRSAVAKVSKQRHATLTSDGLANRFWFFSFCGFCRQLFTTSHRISQAIMQLSQALHERQSL